jgi:hypothetical protein
VGVALLSRVQIRHVKVVVVLALDRDEVHLGAGSRVHLGHRVGETRRVAERHVILDHGQVAALFCDDEKPRVGGEGAPGGGRKEDHVDRSIHPGRARRVGEEPVVQEGGVERRKGALLGCGVVAEVRLEPLRRLRAQRGQGIHVAAARRRDRRGEHRRVAAVDEHVEAAGEERKRQRLEGFAGDLGDHAGSDLEWDLRERGQVGVTPFFESRVRQAALAEARQRVRPQLTEPVRLGAERRAEALEAREVVVAGGVERAHRAAAPAGSGSTSSQP